MKDGYLRREFSKLPKKWQKRVRKALLALSDDCGSDTRDDAGETLFGFAAMADEWCKRQNAKGDFSVYPVWCFLLPQFIKHWDSDGDELSCDGPFDRDGICPHCQKQYDRRQFAISWLLLRMLQQAEMEHQEQFGDFGI